MATGGRNTVSDGPAAGNSYTVYQGCRAQFESGLIHFVTRIRDRRFVVLDTEHGVALAFTFFDHASGNTRTFQNRDGKTVTSGPKTPWTWEIAEAFKVENGRFGGLWRFFHRCPYGMGSGWSSWADSMSTSGKVVERCRMRFVAGGCSELWRCSALDRQRVPVTAMELESRVFAIAPV